MGLACPVCGSENTQKVSLIYESGTSSTNSSSLGIGISGHHKAIGVANTSSNTQSDLAKRCAPPKKRGTTEQGVWTLLGIIPAIGIATVFNSDALGIAVWTLLFAALLASTRSAARYNRDIYPRRYDAWAKRMLCLRCDNMFSP